CCCARPVTPGTTTGRRPFEVSRTTTPSFAAFLPGSGRCAVTTPFGFGEKTCSTRLRRPALRRCAAASVAAIPSTFGTATRPGAGGGFGAAVGPFAAGGAGSWTTTVVAGGAVRFAWWPVRVIRYAAPSPTSTSTRSASSHGQSSRSGGGGGGPPASGGSASGGGTPGRSSRTTVSSSRSG